MQLKVPQVYQIPNSSDCGVACLSMIVQYHYPKTELTYDYIKDKLNCGPVGLTSFSLANFLLQHGFEVDLIYCHPFLFNIHNQHQIFSQEELINHLNLADKRKMPKNWSRSLPELAEFVRSGGN